MVRASGWDGNAFGADEGDVRQADEVQRRLEVGFLVVERGGRRTVAVLTAASGGDEHFFRGGQKADRYALLVIFEGFAGDENTVHINYILGRETPRWPMYLPALSA